LPWPGGTGGWVPVGLGNVSIFCLEKALAADRQDQFGVKETTHIGRGRTGKGLLGSEAAAVDVIVVTRGGRGVDVDVDLVTVGTGVRGMAVVGLFDKGRADDTAGVADDEEDEDDDEEHDDDDEDELDVESDSESEDEEDDDDAEDDDGEEEADRLDFGPDVALLRGNGTSTCLGTTVLVDLFTL
jgi:hypothetical protein